MKLDIAFAMFLAVLGIFLGLHFFPTVVEGTGGVDTTGWSSFLISYEGIMFIVFGILVVLCAISIFFKEE